jgi:hypothetical protein
MKKRISVATAASMLIALLAVTANAQYLTSTKAGFVNYADGKVYILRHDSEDGEKGRASLGTQMRNGDKLSTNPASYAEVLLNPGSYIRLNEKTEIGALSTDFNVVRFELSKGSAIVEIGQVDKKTPIEIVTPHGSIFISKIGLFRIDEKGTATLVSVRQGEIMVGTAADIAANKAAKFGRGKVVTLTGAAKSDVAKLDRDAVDNFDTWSFNRANTLTAANVAALRRNGMYNSLAGGWYYNAFYNCYTFIPRGRFYSPYGFGFFNNWADCYWYNPYHYGYGNRPTYGGGNSGGGVSLPPRVVAGNDREPIRREASGRVLESGILDSGRSGGRFGGDFGSSSGSVSSSSSSSAATVISSPAPSRGSSGGSGGGSMPTRP